MAYSPPNSIKKKDLDDDEQEDVQDNEDEDDDQDDDRFIDVKKRDRDDRKARRDDDRGDKRSQRRLESDLDVDEQRIRRIVANMSSMQSFKDMTLSQAREIAKEIIGIDLSGV